MMTRYGSQDPEDIPDTQDSIPLDLTLQDHPVLEGDSDSSDDYCEEADTHCPLGDLLKQFQQLKNQLGSLKSNTPQSTPTEELTKLTDKLQHPTWCSNQPPIPVRNQHTRPWGHNGHPACNNKGIKSDHNHAPRYPHI